MAAACCNERPFVVGGMSCCLNGDWRGMCLIMLMVFVPMMLIILLSGGGMFS